MQNLQRMGIDVDMAILRVIRHINGHKRMISSCAKCALITASAPIGHRFSHCCRSKCLPSVSLRCQIFPAHSPTDGPHVFCLSNTSLSCANASLFSFVHFHVTPTLTQTLSSISHPCIHPLQHFTSPFHSSCQHSHCPLFPHPPSRSHPSPPPLSARSPAPHSVVFYNRNPRVVHVIDATVADMWIACVHDGVL